MLILELLDMGGGNPILTLILQRHVKKKPISLKKYC